LGNDVKNVHSYTARKLAVECMPHVAFVFFFLIIAEGSRVLSEWFPLMFIGLGILSVYYVGWKATLKKRSEKSLKYAYGQDDLAMECSCVFALFIMFGLFFQDLHHQFPGFFIVKAEATYLHWLLFTVENIFESVVDVLSIYKIRFSGIQPSDNLAKTVILLFRLTVNVVLILLIIRNWKNLRKFWQLNKKGKL
jgi:hypothetical protein